MFSNLSDRLELAFKSLKGEGRLTELNVATSIKEIRRALVDADVNYKIAKDFTDKIKEEALGRRNVLAAIKPGELMIKIVSDALIELMGGQSVGINIKGSPAVILIAGLQGSGKTTFCGKLSHHLIQKRSKRVMLAACDVYRPAAIDQLTVLAQQVGAEIYKETENKNAVEIAKNAVAYAKTRGYDVVIIDTAGRLAVDEAMMKEVEAVKAAINPTETLFVVDAMTGQDAVNTAQAFNARINYDGVVLTKLDGDTRGGAALTVKYTVGKPIKFVSMGEKLDTLDIFYPERMAQRILGMGDIVSLVEKAQEEFDEKEAKQLEKKIKKNQFDFNDFLTQLGHIKKMGNIKSLINMIPGMSKMAQNIDIDDKAFTKIEAMIKSMTPAERHDPELLNPSRRKRIAAGSGHKIDEINQFLRQFEQMRQMMFQMSNMPKGMKFPKMPGM
jgi:signal recognition particle subunit SRP54